VTARRIPEWIVMAAMGARCTRCGGYETCPLPMPVDAFVHWARMVGEMHRWCREKEAKGGGASEAPVPLPG
jgi:hypothetical protein